LSGWHCGGAADAPPSGAVALAKTVIAEGKHPAAIQLTETIAKRRQQEIETMQELLTNL
jgi:uncharacterized protein (DUF305 family)